MELTITVVTTRKAAGVSYTDTVKMSQTVWEQISGGQAVVISEGPETMTVMVNPMHHLLAQEAEMRAR